MKSETLPLSLSKSNLEFQLHGWQIMQENVHAWLGFVEQTSNEALLMTKIQRDELSEIDSWISYATLPSKIYWHQFEHRIDDFKTAQHMMVKNQAVLTSGIQEAIEAWQKSMSTCLNQNSFKWSNVDGLKQWSDFWKPYLPQGVGNEKTKGKAK